VTGYRDEREVEPEIGNDAIGGRSQLVSASYVLGADGLPIETARDGSKRVATPHNLEMGRLTITARGPERLNCTPSASYA